jgi:pyrroline-5-carboxylate reductase
MDNLRRGIRTGAAERRGSQAPVGLVGAGALARSLARGWGEPFLCTDGGSGRAAWLAEELGGRAESDNTALAEAARFVVLCHHAAHLQTVAAEIDGHARCVISALSGVPLADVKGVFRRSPVGRIAVSLLAEVQGSCVWYGGGLEDDPTLEAEVLGAFARLGRVRRLDESLIPVAIGLSGVGPAYLALIVEAEVDAAVRFGLEASVASQAVLETMTGTAELLRRGGIDTLRLRRMVAAPGGPTAHGLAALESAGLRSAFNDAFDTVVRVARASTPPTNLV